MKRTPKFFECGGCGEFHPLGWDGDCRDNNARYTLDRLPENHQIVPEDFVDMEEMEYIMGKAKVLAEKLGMPDVKIEFDPEMVNIQGSRYGSITLDGWVCLYPELIYTETLTGTTYSEGYGLDVGIPIHNYPDAPDDVDVQRIADSHNYLTLLGKAFELIFKERLNNVVEGMGYEEMAEEEKDLPF